MVLNILMIFIISFIFVYNFCKIFFRIIGLCLLQNELCPMFLNRHVLKYILGRPVRFHDLAFFDPVVYESLRQLVVDAETGDSHSLFAALDLNFRYITNNIVPILKHNIVCLIYMCTSTPLL